MLTHTTLVECFIGAFFFAHVLLVILHLCEKLKIELAHSNIFLFYRNYES